MQGKWVPVRGHVVGGRRLQTCATREKTISASVLAGSLPQHQSKRSAGACPPPLGKEVNSQLSCLLGFFVSLLPGRRVRQSASILGKGLGVAVRVGSLVWDFRRTQVANLRYRRESFLPASFLTNNGRWHDLAEGQEMISAVLAHASCHSGAIFAWYSSSTSAAYSGQTSISASSRASFMSS